MTAMTSTAGRTALPHDEEWTVDDLENLPDDGLQYELLDGILLVSPAPVPLHQRVVRKLSLLLDVKCPPEYEIFFAPIDWQPDRRTSLQPDLLIVHNADVGATNITRPLILAVEVLSPSTARKDQIFKRSKYEEAGVLHYWLVDPQKPSITALTLIDGHYITAGQATGDETVTLTSPFPVNITPSDLITR